jgi:hypothetical protein
MIAPLEQADAERAETRQRLRLARRFVASTFLGHRSEPGENAPPIAAWKAWAFAGWVVTVVVVYFATMLGLM